MMRQPCRCICAGTECAALVAVALAPTTVMVSYLVRMRSTMASVSVIRSPGISRVDAPSFGTGRKRGTDLHVSASCTRWIRYNIRMSRYRLQPTQTQEAALLRHCADARYVWNLCVEQESWWRAGRGRMPGFAERCRQLTAAREDNPWLAEGSVIVQQQAIRDHAQAMANFFAALSTGELLHAPGLSGRERNRLVRLQRRLARARKGSHRRGRVKHAV